MQWRVLVAAVALPAQACDVHNSSSPELLAVESLPAFQVVESAVIGGSGAEGPAAFGTVTSVAFLADDAGIAVVDGTVQEIHLFTLNGAHIRDLGRRGGGPGEFRAVRQVAGLSDHRLAVWDVQDSRATQFAADLTVLGAHRADLRPVRAIVPEFVGFLPDGGFVLRDRRNEMGMRDRPEGMVQDTMRLYVYSGTGAFLDTLAVLLDEPTWFRNRDDMWGRQEMIFAPSLTSIVVGGEVWVGSTDQIAFTRYSPDGNAVGRVEVPTVARPASQRDVDEERARRVSAVQIDRRYSMIADGRDMGVRIAEAERNALREVPSNDTIPEYDVAVSGSDGALWLRRYPGPRDSTAVWLQLDSRGTPLGTVRLPRATEVRAATLHWIATLGRDAMDVPMIRLLRVSRGSGGRE